MLSLKDIVERYAAVAKKFGDPVALSDFGLTPEDTVSLFNSFDEDYHISRYLNFSTQPGREYLIDGTLVTHLRIDEGIRSIF